MKTYPPQFAFMQPLASRCELIGNDDDCARFLSTLSEDDRSEFVRMYAKLVTLNLKNDVREWLDGGISEDRSQAWQLLLLLDYMARNGLIPDEQSATRFIEWDHREFDDHGNEW